MGGSTTRALRVAGVGWRVGLARASLAVASRQQLRELYNRQDQGNGMKIFGVILMVLGVIWCGKALQTDVTVRGVSSSDRIHNISLADARRTELNLSALVILSGVLFFGFGSVVERLPGQERYSLGDKVSPPAPVEAPNEAGAHSETPNANELIERVIENDIPGSVALLQAGADPVAPGTGPYDGSTAIDFARGRGHDRLLSILREAAAKRA